MLGEILGLCLLIIGGDVAGKRHHALDRDLRNAYVPKVVAVEGIVDRRFFVGVIGMSVASARLAIVAANRPLCGESQRFLCEEASIFYLSQVSFLNSFRFYPE